MTRILGEKLNAEMLPNDPSYGLTPTRLPWRSGLKSADSNLPQRGRHDNLKIAKICNEPAGGLDNR